MSDAPNHAGPETPEMIEDPEMGSTWVIGIGGTFIFVACCLAVAALLYDMERAEEDAVSTSVPIAALESLEAEQAARLDGEVRRERREDTGDGTAVVIPIDRAMELVVDEYGG